MINKTLSAAFGAATRAALLCGALAACSADEGDGGANALDAAGMCASGELRACLGLGCPASQRCADDGRWGACACGWDDRDASADLDAAVGLDGAVTADAATDGAVLEPIKLDLSADFPGAQNPNGVWRYGWSASFGASQAYTSLIVTADGPTWNDPSHLSLGTPSIWKNTTDHDVFGVLPGAVALHPGQSGEYSLVAVTLPTAGMWSVHVESRAGDSGETDVTVFVDGASVFTALTSSEPVFELAPAPLQAGTEVSVWVGPNGDGASDNTPLSFAVKRW